MSYQITDVAYLTKAQRICCWEKDVLGCLATMARESQDVNILKMIGKCLSLFIPVGWHRRQSPQHHLKDVVHQGVAAGAIHSNAEVAARSVRAAFKDRLGKIRG